MQNTEVKGDITIINVMMKQCNIIRSGLGCFGSKTLLAKALEFAISDQVIMIVMIMMMMTIIM